MSGVERADEMTIACLHKRDVTLETRLAYDGVFTPISRIKKIKVCAFAQYQSNLNKCAYIFTNFDLDC